jgi:hypothetical protein
VVQEAPLASVAWVAKVEGPDLTWTPASAVELVIFRVSTCIPLQIVAYNQ